jgi:hypothetical protein
MSESKETGLTSAPAAAASNKVAYREARGILVRVYPK